MKLQLPQNELFLRLAGDADQVSGVLFTGYLGYALSLTSNSHQLPDECHGTLMDTELT